MRVEAIRGPLRRQYGQITVEQLDAVLRITLNRPERMNAWTRP